MSRIYWWLPVLALMITFGAASAQAVDVNLTTAGDGYGDSYLQKHVTTPLARNLSTFVRFVYSVCALTALVGGLRIYIRVQAGETEMMREVWRWGAAILTVLGLTTGLGHLLENQQFGRGVVISSESMQVEHTPVADPLADGPAVVESTLTDPNVSR